MRGSARKSKYCHRQAGNGSQAKCCHFAFLPRQKQRNETAPAWPALPWGWTLTLQGNISSSSSGSSSSGSSSSRRSRNYLRAVLAALATMLAEPVSLTDSHSRMIYKKELSNSWNTPPQSRSALSTLVVHNIVLCRSLCRSEDATGLKQQRTL